jgi:glycosyltransferase involved in cell wall biosynthesis
MKIVHAIFSFNIGGSETMLVDIINHQCRVAAVSLIVVNDKVNLDLLNTIDKSVNVFLLKRTESAKFQLFSVYFKICRIVNQISPDVIHCHDNKLFPFFVCWKQKCCITIHGMQLSTVFLKCYRQVFSVSTAVRIDIKKRTGVDATIIYNGIELNEYQTRSNYDFDPDRETFKIVQVSRLEPVKKGQHIAIEAIYLLKKQYPDIKMEIYFVGGGESLAELQLLVTKYNLQKQVIFIGQVNRNWVKKHLQDYHLLIQPSIFEGFGLTITEGFACGLPVIASNLDGPEEIVRILKAGLPVRPNDPIDLAEKIYCVYQSYLSNTVKNSSYLVEYKQQLEIFNIRSTVKLYMDYYSRFKN